ncbi:hypothetical protein KUTeg_001390 [Tegillarca granosa]|uniref:Crossover junction endonuclease MUS81 n=1 Tax=Tegillarca granosa TaxID=220873 RepID=A0ABQ9FRA6_TEGGR|nr:hypothetical protein KUTeg_001390 [Tegillarca granosa]
MIRRKRNIRIYVRNKMRYNPEAKVYDFLHVEIDNFAGTTIGHIKEDVKRRCGNSSLKIDDLYLDNQKLADDRSVAHYNLEDGTILETTSNPFWVTCLNIKRIEVEQEQAQNPNDKHTQNWTQRSILRKRTLLSVLLNSKKEFQSQPPHFPELEDLVMYLERLGKKGAQMNPNYTQKDLQLMYQDYISHDLGSDDPIGSFIHRHAVRLGLRQPGKNHYDNRGTGIAGDETTDTGTFKQVQNKTPRAPRNRNKERWCEDCEVNRAEIYCPDCQNAHGGQGLVLCGNCSQTLHLGAARRRHNVKDRQPRLSMTEKEIKLKAQPLTDTDLQDKQNGRYVGGFECMENSLISKGLVQREASANPTYALTETGQELAGMLFNFQQSVQRYMRSNDQPQQIPQHYNTACGTRKVCLIIDEQERDKERLLEIAARNNIDAQVLPFIVERKSWEDLENSIKTKRFQKQVNNMLESGLICYYLLEGYVQNLRYKATEQHQKFLKGHVEKLLLDHGFYLNYTGILKDRYVTYATYLSRTSRQRVDNVLQRSDFRSCQLTVWMSHKFIDSIFSDWYKEKPLLDLVKEETTSTKVNKHLLVIQGLENYNKKRQSLMNKCLLEAYDYPNIDVYVVRTETADETRRLQTEIQQRSNECQRLHQSQGQRLQAGEDHQNTRTRKTPQKRKHQSNDINKTPDKTTITNIEEEDYPSDLQTETFMLQQALALSSSVSEPGHNQVLMIIKRCHLKREGVLLQKHRP